MAAKKEFVMPKDVAGCADALYQTRAKRLEIQRDVEELEGHEKQLKEFIINNLPKSNATGITGRIATARIETKKIPQIKDRLALQAYIKRNNRFDLLQNRLAEGAVLEMWDDGKKVPGVEAFTVVKVSCTKK